MSEQTAHEKSAYDKLPPKQRKFVDAYVGRARFNATRAAIAAKYSKRSARNQGSRMMKNDDIREAISERLRELAMTDAEAAHVLSEHARGSMSAFVRPGPQGRLLLDTTTAEARKSLHLVKKWKQREKVLRSMGEDGEDEIRLVEVYTEVELYDAQSAAKDIRRAHGAYGARGTEDDPVITEIRLVEGPAAGRSDAGSAGRADGQP